MVKRIRLTALCVAMLMVGFVPLLWAQEAPPISTVPLDSPAYLEEVSEDQTISMDLQEAFLKDVLKIFSVQSGLNFIANESVQDKRITLFLDKVPIKEAMEKLFDVNNLVYEYDESAAIFIVKGRDEERDMITKVFPLRYRSVMTANLERQRTQLFQTTGTGNVGTTVETAEVSDIKTIVQQVLTKNGKVTEDNKSNSLIVTDMPYKFPVIAQVIAKLDVPQPQVLLEVEMLDVSKNLIDELGFKFENNPLIFNFATATKGLTFPFSSGGRLKSDSGSTALSKDSAGSMTAGSNLAVSLNMLKTDVNTKYLARPRILTLNNETAEISITKDEVVERTTTTTTSSATSEESTTFKRATELTLTPEGIGIFLRVTPLINMDTGEITMVVNPKSSSTSRSPLLAEGSTEAFDPEVRSTKSIVKIRDGETVVLGGLIHNEKEVTKTKVPVFGSLPIVGMLFRSKDVPKNLERELLVFITPHIVRDQSLPSMVPPRRNMSSYDNRQRSGSSKVTLFTRHEAVNTALNNMDR